MCCRVSFGWQASHERPPWRPLCAYGPPCLARSADGSVIARQDSDIDAVMRSERAPVGPPRSPSCFHASATLLTGPPAAAHAGTSRAYARPQGFMRLPGIPQAAAIRVEGSIQRYAINEAGSTMWNLISCYLSGRHDYQVRCEPGAIFLCCNHCGKRSMGWELRAQKRRSSPGAGDRRPAARRDARS